MSEVRRDEAQNGRADRRGRDVGRRELVEERASRALLIAR
jgi:hypothetical protein